MRLVSSSSSPREATQISGNFSGESDWTTVVESKTATVPEAHWQTSTTLSVLSSSTLQHNVQKTVENVTIFSRYPLEDSMNTTNVTASPELGSCSDWQDVQHALFQLANLCLVVSFLTPSSFQHHAFFLRFILGFGYLFFTLWTGLFVCMPDVLGWNCLFFLVNLGHLLYLAYRMFPTRFRSELEELYQKVFRPLRVSRQQFRELSDTGDLYVLTKGTFYAKENSTECGQKLAILIKGRLKVMYQQLFLHFIEVDQLVDSPEYDAYRLYGHSGATYQVSIVAGDDSLLLTWQIPKLRKYLDSHSFMAAILHVIVGKDVSTKLYQIQELLLTNPNYMQSVSSRRSSLVNVRNAIVTNKSNPNFNTLNCFGIDLKGWPSSSSTGNLDTKHLPTDTHESCV